MDIMMPGMEGMEATRILRSRLETIAILIMMSTAKTDKRSEIASLNIWADNYLTKPFDHDKLIARVKGLLSRRSGDEK